MKKLGLFILAALLLTACGAPKDFETMSDVYDAPQPAEAAEMVFSVPQDAAVQVMEAEGAGSLYQCDGYSVMAQTLSSGDLDATLRAVTGYPRDALQVLQRKDGTLTRYECVWSSAGEGGDQVGRAVILDDGSYHYCLSVMCDAENAGKLAQAWQKLFDGFSIAP